MAIMFNFPWQQGAGDEGIRYTFGDSSESDTSGNDDTGLSDAYLRALENLLGYEVYSAEKANQFTAEQNQKAMDFSAQQAALDRAFQQSSSDKAMQFTADQAALTRQWETQMSNTAYSRAMADLKKAGVNPLLAVTAGQSSTPTVGVASGFSSAGATASGYSGSGLKANASSIVQSIVSMINTQSTNSAKIASSAISAIANLLGSFVPK